MQSQHSIPNGFEAPRAGLRAAEALTVVVAAGFTAVLWLAIAWPDGTNPPSTQAGTTRSVTFVTLPRVEVVGRRDSLRPSPSVVAAENTAPTTQIWGPAPMVPAANRVNLKQ